MSWTSPLENSPEVINQRLQQWPDYDGGAMIQMVHGQTLFLLPGDDYSKTLFVYRRQHIGLLLGLARINLRSRGRGYAVDVGANIGYVSGWLSGRPDVEKVFSFEPNAYVFNRLQLNVGHKIQAENLLVGASSVEEKVPFARNLTNSGWSGPGSVREGFEVERVLTTQVSLDDYFLSGRGVGGRCSLIKIDVEGSEADVLQGARNLIDSHTPTLVIEFNAYSDALRHELEAIQQRCKGAYRAFWADSDGQLHKTTVSRFNIEHNDLILIPQTVEVRDS